MGKHTARNWTIIGTAIGVTTVTGAYLAGWFNRPPVYPNTQGTVAINGSTTGAQFFYTGPIANAIWTFTLSVSGMSANSSIQIFGSYTNPYPTQTNGQLMATVTTSATGTFSGSVNFSMSPTYGQVPFYVVAYNTQNGFYSTNVLNNSVKITIA